MLVPACEKKQTETKPKSPKKAIPAAQASQRRQALNVLSRTLRELPSVNVFSTDASRGTYLLSQFKKVPAEDLPESLRTAWQEMAAVLEAVSKSGLPSLSADLRHRGEAAAEKLNAALAAEGLTDFQF